MRRTRRALIRAGNAGTINYDKWRVSIVAKEIAGRTSDRCDQCGDTVRKGRLVDTSPFGSPVARLLAEVYCAGCGTVILQKEPRVA